MSSDLMAQRVKKILFFLLILLLAGCAVFCLLAAARGYFRSVESFRAYMQRFGVLAPAVFTMVQAMQVVIPVLPGFIGCAVGAGLFGAAGGFACNYIGICAGSLISFWLAKQFGLPLVEQMVPMQKYQKFSAWVTTRKSYTLVFFLCILLPLAPDDFLCWLSGLLGMPGRRFVWIILLAKPWCILFYSLLFAGLIR